MWNVIWKFLCNQDWLMVFIPMLVMTIMFYCAKLNFWGIMFTVIMAIFGLTELVAELMTGHTISQQFAGFLRTHKIFAWGIIWSMIIFWFGLICHLLTTGAGGLGKKRKK